MARKRRSRNGSRAWWEPAQAEGEKQSLIEAVLAGDWDGSNAAERLIKKYPRDALGPIVAAAARKPGTDSGGNFVYFAARIPGDASTQFLIDEMDKGPNVHCRVMAAQGLLDRGRPEAIPAMLAFGRASTRIPCPPRRPAAPRPASCPSMTCGRSKCFAFSNRQAPPAAIDALTKYMRKHRIDRRIEIVAAFDKNSVFGKGPSAEASGRQPAEPVALRRAEVEKAVERLFITAMDDTEQARRDVVLLGRRRAGFKIRGSATLRHTWRPSGSRRSMPSIRRDRSAIASGSG